MSGASRPGWHSPVGTSKRIRMRAIWAVAFVAASVLPGIASTGLVAGSEDWAKGALPIAIGLWTFGTVFALWAAFPTLRYWEHLPNSVRWLGALPLIAILFFLVAVPLTVL